MGEPHESIPLPQHHTPPPNHVVILPVCSSKLRPLSAIIIIPTTFLGGCGTKEEYACEKMGIDRNSCCEPQDLGHRGPDQSIDFVGDGRLGCELEVSAQHSRYANGRIRCRTCCTSCCPSRGGRGCTSAAGKDAFQPEADVFRDRLEAQDHQGGQEHAGSEFGGQQEVCGECAEVDEGGCTEGGG